jgi:hypothetical protein
VSSRRTHEWAWGDVGRRTVCGLVHRLHRIQVVSDLGPFAPEDRCRNCERMRAAIGASSKPVVSADSTPIPVVAAPAGELTERELHIMAHATGWDSRWPLYRNHFCAGEGHDAWPSIQGLIGRGLMRVTREPSDLSGGDTVFGVTAIGIAALKGRGQTRSGQIG